VTRQHGYVLKSESESLNASVQMGENR
jgi:hypothetical protein